jgi:ATP-dependent Clp protease ATP-binding subunit ClpC
MTRPTTVRFSEPVYSRLEEASAVTGLPVNSILVVAVMDWLEAHPLDRLGVASRSRLAAEPSQSEPEDLVPRRLPFERLDGSARRALALALQEARRRVGVMSPSMRRLGSGGVTHVGSEDLLVGLLREGESLGARVLASLGVDVERVRSLVASRPTEPLAIPLTLGMTTVGGVETETVVPDALPTRRLQAVIGIAFTQAKLMGDAAVRSEHLLLGLVIDDEGLADHVLKELGVTRERVAAEIERLPGSGGADEAEGSGAGDGG